MKKSLPIILLSVFTLAFSAFGFMGIQPVKAATSVAGITIEDGQVGYEGVSITHADQALNQEGEAVSSGDGKMKFYSSLPQSLYNSLQGKDYKTGTLIIPAELLQGESVADKLNTLDITKVSANGAINVDTTNVWTLYDVDNDEVEDDVDDEYWAMASLYNIPRAYYGVEMAARSYLAVKEDGAEDYTYVYSATDDVTAFYSLTTTALKKLEAGDYDDKEELKTAITNDYTKFKVTFHFDEVNKDFVHATTGVAWQPTKTMTVSYGDILPTLSSIYSGTFFMNYNDGQYLYMKGFFNKDKSAFAYILGLNMTENDVTTKYAVNGSAEGATYYPSALENEKFLTKVYGDMHLYEEVAPANLVDDFSTSQAVDGAYSYKTDVVDEAAGTFKNNYWKYLQNEGAAWYSEKTDTNGVTESGVLAIPSQFMTNSKNNGITTSEHRFHFTSVLRNHAFWGKYVTGIQDVAASDYYTGSIASDFDYANLRVYFEAPQGVETVEVYGVYGKNYGNYANQNLTTVPVNTWVNIKIDRGHLRETYNAGSISAFREQNRSANAILTVHANGYEEGAFTMYIDYIAYERDMRIGLIQENGELKNGYRTITNPNNRTNNPNVVRYDQVTSVIGEEVTLGTALTNGTIVYTVTDPDGEAVDLIDGNKFTPTKFGNYTVKATCDDYALLANSYPVYDFKSKQYGEMTFEVVERKVTPTLKNAEGTAIDLETAFNIGNPVTIDFAVEGVDTILPESATYEVKYLVNDSTVEVTDGVFTPLNAGQYSVVVKYVDVKGYESASEEVILDTVGRIITPAFSVGGEVVDINSPILMDSVVTISALVEGIDAPVAENFSYKVERLDSVEENNVELDVVNGQFTAYYTGTYNIFVYYKEGQVTHASEMITLTVETDIRYINDFSDSTSVLAAYKVTTTKDTSHKAGFDIETDVAPNTQWHEFKTDENGVTKYGVISTKPQVETWSLGTAGINLRFAKSVSQHATEYPELRNFVFGIETDAYTGDILQRAVYETTNWDYLSIPVYFPAPEGKTSADTITVKGHASYGGTFAVHYNTWTELQIEKLGLAYNFASSNIFWQFTTYTHNTPTFFITDMNQEVYIDSMAFKKYEDRKPFDSITFTDVTDANDKLTYSGVSTDVALRYYKEQIVTKDGSTVTNYVSVPTTITFDLVVDGKPVPYDKIQIAGHVWGGKTANVSKTWYFDNNGVDKSQSLSAGLLQAGVNSGKTAYKMVASFKNGTSATVTLPDETTKTIQSALPALGNYKFIFKYEDENGNVYWGYKHLGLTTIEVPAPVA